MRFLSLLLLAAVPLAAAGIENLRCEPAAAGAYRIAFDAPPGAFPIRLYAGTDPGRLPPRPMLLVRQSPVEVALPGQSGRVYFHLKPAKGPVRVAATRSLPLEGASNFRDMGGYIGAGGRPVRWGLLFRSNHLGNLTTNDYALLSPLGIRLVCDLRIESERKSAPTRWQGPAPPEFLEVPVNTLTYVPATATVTERMIMVYGRVAFDAIPEFQKVLRRILRGQLPVVIHCTSGKDRTGVLSALLLRALGVSPDVVREDYMLTNRYISHDKATLEMAASYLKRMGRDGPVDDAALVQLLGVQREYLDTALRSIDAKYGSFDAYLRQGVGLSPADLAKLRQRLLERE
jgi:protein-tyrosine phosphatase